MIDPTGSAASFDARCVHAGEEAPGLGMATPPITPPIFQSSVFKLRDMDALEAAFGSDERAFTYSRLGNPTVAALEQAVASLEGAQAAVAMASGMGAISAALLGLLRPGDTLVTTAAVYGTTRQLMDDYLAPLGITVAHRPAEALLREGLPAGTRLLFAEPLSNPLLVAADLPRLADLAHGAGAQLVVDNTFASPYHCRPLEQGADLVLHSATKYLGGHGDLTLGAVAGPAEMVAAVRRAAIHFGPTAAPLEAWLALRGIRTLHLRMARHAANAATVAAFLAGDARVRRVHYPGLASHGTHEVAARVLSDGYGGMLSFELAGGGGAEARSAFERFLAGLRMIPFAASLADVSTTLSHPATTSHRGQSDADRAAQGIGQGLVRLSCGLERAEDIVADLELGLASV